MHFLSCIFGLVFAAPKGGEACSVTEGVVSRVEAPSAGPADSLRVVRKLFADNSLRLCGSIHHLFET